MDFEKVVVPFLKEHCLRCHGPDKQAGKFRLDPLKGNLTPVAGEVPHWQAILERLATGEMPPKEEPRPDRDATQKMIAWLEESLRQAGSESTITRELAFPVKGNTVDHDLLFGDATGRVPGGDPRIWRRQPVRLSGHRRQSHASQDRRQGPHQNTGAVRAGQRSRVSRLRLPLQGRQLRNRADGDERQEDRGADAQITHQGTPGHHARQGSTHRKTGAGCRRLHVRACLVAARRRRRNSSATSSSPGRASASSANTTDWCAAWRWSCFIPRRSSGWSWPRALPTSTAGGCSRRSNWPGRSRSP